MVFLRERERERERERKRKGEREGGREKEVIERMIRDMKHGWGDIVIPPPCHIDA